MADVVTPIARKALAPGAEPMLQQLDFLRKQVAEGEVIALTVAAVKSDHNTQITIASNGAVSRTTLIGAASNCLFMLNSGVGL